MNNAVTALIGLLLLSSGCLGGNEDSQEFLSEYDSSILEMTGQDQETTFVLNRSSESYTVQTSSPQTASEMFADSENRTRHLTQTCETLQRRMYELGLEENIQDERNFELIDKEGEVLERNRAVNMSKFAELLESYNLSQVRYDVSSASGENVASCLIENKEPEGLEVNFNSN